MLFTPNMSVVSPDHNAVFCQLAKVKCNETA